MQTPLLFRNTKVSAPARASEKRGAVYTKPRITELILDMAGYKVRGNLAAKFAVEPAAGEGAFLVPMAIRLIRSARSKGREPLECRDSLLAYELDQGSADITRAAAGGAALPLVPHRRADDRGAVSYTHLTLPTKRIV